ncbi:hypothetical protein Tco_1122754 [Tanacetum coccineum]|uniref:Uncharacterized protein n=1 Tax=Tanacetum coccineum TaxID=301880 RepID=A0ABQ5J1E5_9ASTR
MSLTGVMIPLAEPLSLKSLIGEASTFSDTEPQDEDPPAITFEKEELDTTLESAAVADVPCSWQDVPVAVSELVYFLP